MLASLVLALASFVSSVSSHIVITYPGWRGNNLHDSGRTPDGLIPEDGLGVRYNNASGLEYPYGMQWIYPCSSRSTLASSRKPSRLLTRMRFSLGGGMPLSSNRTKWPVTGGAIAFQPGWFAGHQNALVYINLGLGSNPQNMSKPMLPVFQLTGPTNDMYPGTYCLPQVPLPAGVKVNVGDNATIQIVETAVHGAALYSCVDITFSERAEPVNSSNCFNSSQGMDNGGPIGQNFVYTAPGMSSMATDMSVQWTTALLLSVGAMIAALI